MRAADGGPCIQDPSLTTVSVLQLPQQLQRRRVVAGGVQLVLEFLFLGLRPGACGTRPGAAAARPPGRRCCRPTLLHAAGRMPPGAGCRAAAAAGPGRAARPSACKAYSPSSSRRSPGCCDLLGRHLGRGRRHQGRLGQQHLEQLAAPRAGRRPAASSGVGLRRRPAARRPLAGAAVPRSRAQTVSSLSASRWAIRLTISSRLTAPAWPGISGARAMTPSTASTARRRPSTPCAGFGRQHLVQLELQRVDRAGQRLPERLRPLLHQQVARVEPGGQRGDGQVDVLADEDLQGPIDAGVAAGVGVEHQHHARHEAPQLLHVPGVQGRAHRGHHLGDAHLVGHQHVGVALDDRQVAGLGRRPAGPGRCRTAARSC